MARACVSCSDQWKVRDQNKISAPFTEACGSSSSCVCSREVWTGGRGESLWCDATPEGVTIREQRVCPLPVIYPTCPSQRRGAGRHQDQAAPPVPLSKHVIQPQPLLPPTAPLIK